jgi:hypothetical protein
MMTGLEVYIIGGLERMAAVTVEKKYGFNKQKRPAIINKQSASSSFKTTLKVKNIARKILHVSSAWRL